MTNPRVKSKPVAVATRQSKPLVGKLQREWSEIEGKKVIIKKVWFDEGALETVIKRGRESRNQISKQIVDVPVAYLSQAFLRRGDASLGALEVDPLGGRDTAAVLVAASGPGGSGLVSVTVGKTLVVA